MRAFFILALGLVLSGCVTVAPPVVAPPDPVVISDGRQTPRAAAETFLQVVAAVEPVAEAQCRARAAARDCDFRIVVDDRPGQPPNAFQTVDRQGRPIVGFTHALIADARNADELAFVMGHEAAHHIAGHIPKRADQALSGALLAGVLAQASGLGADEIRAAQNMGAEVAARSYSKEFELEADALGAEIALIAGFDPIRGSAFFDRLPDPGDKFLGSHPPNADRKALVVATVRRMTGS
jgi:predicted Zn-dependent protease